MQIKWQIAALLLLAAFLLGLLLSANTTTDTDHTIRDKELIRTRFDTAYRVVTIAPSPVRASGASNRMKPIALHDTIYQAPCLDTILVTDTSAVSPDTISVCYVSVVDSFTISLRLSPRRKEVAIPYIVTDTFFWHTDSIRAAANKKWYDDVLMVIVSIAAGMILSKL